MNKDFTNAAVPHLKDQAEFIAYAQANQWSTRKERGWPYQQDVFEYIKTVYAPYLAEKRLTRSDLQNVDKKLWWALHNRLRHEAMPEDLHLPTEAQAKLDGMQDGPEKELMIKKRSLWRELNKLQRQKPS